MKKTIFTTIISLLFWVVNHAQEIKFGKVSMEELTQTAHPVEPDAEAAILYRSYNTTFNYSSNSGFTLITKIFQRIKIYNKKGMDLANQDIYLYFDNKDKEKTQGIRGYTFNLDNGKITKSKLENENIFKEERFNKYYNKTSIAPPNVLEGSVVDIEYEITSPFLGNIPELIFQEEIPVDYAEAEITAPEYFIYKQHLRGQFPLTFNEKNGMRMIQITEKVSGDAGVFNGVQQTKTYSDKVDLNETTYTIAGQNISSMKEEAFVNNIHNYRTAIKFEITGTKYPREPFKMLAQTWTDVAKSIYEISSFGAELAKTNYFAEDLQALINGQEDPTKKAILIFSHVKSKINWDGTFGVLTDKGVTKAYKDGSGNAAEINLMLTAMFRQAGLKANPVLVSTRKNGIPIFPTRDGFNYVIAAIEMQEGIVLFDATEKYAVPNILPERAINWMGRLVREDGTSIEVSLLPKTPSKQVAYFSAQLNEDGSAAGKVRIQNYDQYAFNFRERIKNLNKDLYLERLENKTFNSDIEVSNYQMQNESDLSKPVIENFEFKKEDQCEIIGGKIYVSPLLFSGMIENPLKLEKREYPIEFSFPTTNQYLITIKIPEGYQIESVPESLALQLPEDIGSYQYNITAKANQIQVKLTSEIKSPLISAQGYEMIKNYYQQIVQKNAEKIVLTKI